MIHKDVEFKHMLMFPEAPDAGVQGNSLAATRKASSTRLVVQVSSISR